MEAPVTHSLVKALRVVPAFASLDDRALLAVAGASSNLFWQAGSLVFEQGSPADGLFIVLSGTVRIFDEADPETDVRGIGPGDYFGELSLLTDTNRTKCAEAAEDSELLVLPKDSFDALLAANPELERHCRQRAEELMAADAAGA